MTNPTPPKANKKNPKAPATVTEKVPTASPHMQSCDASRVVTEVLKGKQTLTVDEAAAYLGCRSQDVTEMLDDGHVEGEKVGGQWSIPADALFNTSDTGENDDMGGYCSHEFRVINGLNDPIYKPVESIPMTVQDVIDRARAGTGTWKEVGTALGQHMLDVWPSGRCIDRPGTGIDAVAMSLYEESPVQTDLTVYLFQLVWINFRFPSVIEDIPENELLAVTRSVMKKIMG